MKNYKIKVNNEAESKEAQELFEQLGFAWAGDHPKNGDWYSHLYAENSTCCYLSPFVWNGLLAKFQELTLPQLRDLVVQSKNEQGLISGADALRALADGKEVEYLGETATWFSLNKETSAWSLTEVLNATDLKEGTSFKFRLKPRTITLNGIEIPAPFEPKEFEDCYMLTDLYEHGYVKTSWKYSKSVPAWRTEEEIKQVVAALRNIFGKK